MTARANEQSRAGRIWWRMASVAEPLVRLLLRRRLARGKELPERIGERRGEATLARPQGRLLWLHAASVGETVSVLALLEALCTIDQDLHVLMTTGSLTSQRLLAQRLYASGLADRVLHQFVPLDVPRWLLGFLKHWRPQAMALVESELWPNLIACAAAHDIPMALLNARLSARSHRGWQKMPGLARAMLGRFRWITARSDEDADRLRALGAAVVDSPGDLKAAAAPLPADEPELQRLRRITAERPILLAACTHDGEEAVIAQAHALLRSRWPALLTIIAPRHPERGAAISARLDAAPRRALGQDPDLGHGFWIGDTLGEMGLLYRLSPIAFVGNSLNEVLPSGGGGHNPFEPTRLGCAIATGPLSFNFNNAVRALLEADGIEITPNAQSIADWADRLLSDPSLRDTKAAAGRRVAARASDLAPVLARRLLSLMDQGEA
jgi:3-deoxy-D-manno-octulosonic-acid transferase